MLSDITYATQTQYNHCVKSVRIWRFSGLYFLAFGVNTERYCVSLRIQQSKRGKIRTRKTPNTGTFHAVNLFIHQN